MNQSQYNTNKSKCIKYPFFPTIGMMKIRCLMVFLDLSLTWKIQSDLMVLF